MSVEGRTQDAGTSHSPPSGGDEKACAAEKAEKEQKEGKRKTRRDGPVEAGGGGQAGKGEVRRTVQHVAAAA